MNFTRANGRLDADNEITEQDIENVLRRPDSFAWFGEPGKLFVTWALGPMIEHRDSVLLDQSNAAALVKLLKSDGSLDGDWKVERCSHWLVGWTRHLSFRALDDDGSPTRVFRVTWEFFRSLREDYPIADENDLSERQEAVKVLDAPAPPPAAEEEDR